MRINLSKKKLDYKDVFLYPQYSEVTSRTQVSTETHIKERLDSNFVLDVPVLSANMDTCTDGNMALAMYKAGALGAIHRFMPIEENVCQFNVVHEAGGECFVSVGVNKESRDRAIELHKAGARNFIVDIAHGHSKMMKEMLKFLRHKFGVYALIMAGNVATKEGCLDLISWGADAIKIGIGPGAVCTTKNVTGVTVPQFSAVMECCELSREECNRMYNSMHMNNRLTRPLFVADGGIQEIGDIAKALAAGADLVMCGRLFAGCDEAPGPRVNGKKVYRGMASRDAMLTIKDASALPTPEGVSTVLDVTGEKAADVVSHIKGGLQSAMSYSNATNLREFRELASFGVRR